MKQSGLGRQMRPHLAVLASGLLLAVLSMLKKLIEVDFSDTFLVAARMLVAAVFVFVFANAIGRGRQIRVVREEIPAFAVIGAAMALAFYFYFLSLSELPFGLAMMLVFTTPLFAVFSESFFERTPVGGKVLASCLLLVLGVGLVFLGSLFSGEIRMEGLVFGLIGAASSAFADEHIKFEERRQTLFNVVFWPLLIGGVFLFPVLALEKASIYEASQFSYYMLAGIGLLTGIIFVLFDYSLEFLDAHVSSAVHNSSALLASLAFSYLLFYEQVEPVALAGGLVIILASFLINRHSHTHKLKAV